MRGDRLRLWSTLALAVSAVVCILTGVGLQTVFRPVTTVHESVTLSEIDAAHVAIIRSSTLTAHVGTPVVTAEGSDGVYVATGDARDVRAWRQDAKVVSIRWQASQPDGARLAARVTGSAQAPSPIGSDL